MVRIKDHTSFRKRELLVCIVSRLSARRRRVRIPAGVRFFLFSKTCRQTARSISLLFHRHLDSTPGVKLPECEISHAPPVSRFTISAAISPVSGGRVAVQRLARSWAVRISKPVRGRFLCTQTDWHWGSPSVLYNKHWISFPRAKRLGVVLTKHSHIAPRLKKEKSYTSTPLWAFMTWTGTNSFIFNL